MRDKAKPPLPTSAMQMALPLREVVLAWCDPTLVLEYAEAHHDRVIVHEPKPWATPTAEGWGFDAATEFHLAARREEVEKLRRAILDRQEASEAALVRDFRDRLVRGDIVLTGLRIRPNLDLVRSVIPAAWAELLLFDWNEAKVHAREFEFIDVLGERLQASSIEGATAERQVYPTSVAVQKPERPSQGVRGRENYEPLIEEAFQACYGGALKHWDTNPDKKPENTVLAREMCRWLIRKYPERHMAHRLPKEETIRTRVPKIYERLRVGKTVR